MSYIQKSLTDLNIFLIKCQVIQLLVLLLWLITSYKCALILNTIIAQRLEHGVTCIQAIYNSTCTYKVLISLQKHLNACLINSWIYQVLNNVQETLPAELQHALATLMLGHHSLINLLTLFSTNINAFMLENLNQIFDKGADRLYNYAFNLVHGRLLNFWFQVLRVNKLRDFLSRLISLLDCSVLLCLTRLTTTLIISLLDTSSCLNKRLKYLQKNWHSNCQRALCE